MRARNRRSRRDDGDRELRPRAPHCVKCERHPTRRGDARDALRAGFPGGTITGCPKVRCMEIIGELEHVPRGAYTGSLGYLNLDGSGDFNILIRTIVRNGDRLSLRRAGAGIGGAFRCAKGIGRDRI